MWRCFNLVPLEFKWHLSHRVKQKWRATQGSRVQIKPSWRAWKQPGVILSGSCRIVNYSWGHLELTSNQAAAPKWQKLFRSLSWAWTKVFWLVPDKIWSEAWGWVEHRPLSVLLIEIWKFKWRKLKKGNPWNSNSHSALNRDAGAPDISVLWRFLPFAIKDDQWHLILFL